MCVLDWFAIPFGRVNRSGLPLCLCFLCFWDWAPGSFRSGWSGASFIGSVFISLPLISVSTGFVLFETLI